MWPDQVSHPESLVPESNTLLTASRGPACGQVVKGGVGRAGSETGKEKW